MTSPFFLPGDLLKVVTGDEGVPARRAALASIDIVIVVALADDARWGSMSTFTGVTSQGDVARFFVDDFERVS